MELKVTGGYSDLIQGLQGLPVKVDRLGQEWTRESAQLAKTKYISNLDRSSSQSSIHSLKGEHGRLRDQLSIEFAREGDTWIAVLGFPDNWATAAAITQDQGATIEVTEKMRDFFLAIGRPLREGKIVIDIPGSGDWTDAMRESTEEAQWLLNEFDKHACHLM